MSARKPCRYAIVWGILGVAALIGGCRGFLGLSSEPPEAHFTVVPAAESSSLVFRFDASMSLAVRATIVS